MRQEKRSPNHWNPKLDKELQRSDQFLKNSRKRKKAHLNYFVLFPVILVSLAGSICLPQQSPQIFPTFFQLPTSLLSRAECLHRTQTSSPCLPTPGLPASAHAPLLSSGRGFLLSKASPLDGLGPQVLQEGLQSSTWAPSHLNLHRLRVLPYFKKCLLLTPDSPCSFLFTKL